jgi:hypothetical protein
MASARRHGVSSTPLVLTLSDSRPGRLAVDRAGATVPPCRHLYDDLVPLAQLQAGFLFDGERVSFGSFQKGIHRARVQRGPAALTLTTSLKAASAAA